MSTPNSHSELRVENLCMTYHTEDGQDVHALEDINFNMDEGNLVVVVGPSGCGKTTLLSTIAGFLAPTSGRILLNGEEIEKPGAERGVVFQKGALFEWLTVYENSVFGLKMRGVDEAKRHERVMNYLDLVGLTDFVDTPIYNLSGGMQQRVAIVRCLANNPSILLMDEPLGALDALTREKMQTLILKIWKETGKMVFFITHSVEEAIYLATDLFVMSARPGKIMKRYKLDFCHKGLEKDPRELKSDPEFIKIREEVLSLIWSMEEETAAHAG
ncbi:MAG: ABC transporter ATP-binding protein [Desulfosarcinaceae bacterium]|nr:ABC transporter ATP-binding protein [Desulfosarcinaceae bacterium]